jgi:hypothetical protein
MIRRLFGVPRKRTASANEASRSASEPAPEPAHTVKMPDDGDYASGNGSSSRELELLGIDLATIAAGIPSTSAPRRNAPTKRAWRCHICKHVNKINRPEWHDLCQGTSGVCRNKKGEPHKRCDKCWREDMADWPNGSDRTRWTKDDIGAEPDSDDEHKDKIKKGYYISSRFDGSPADGDKSSKYPADVDTVPL